MIRITETKRGYKATRITNGKPRKSKNPVTLIPSGYEWICPACEYYNELTKTRKKVICEDCKAEFEAKVEYPS